jgi:hypothetical protein
MPAWSEPTKAVKLIISFWKVLSNSTVVLAQMRLIMVSH